MGFIVLTLQHKYFVFIVVEFEKIQIFSIIFSLPRFLLCLNIMVSSQHSGQCPCCAFLFCHHRSPTGMDARTPQLGLPSSVIVAAHPSLSMDASFLISYIKNLVQVTLDSDNFFFWMKQLKNTLCIGNLVGFLDDTNPCVAPYITNPIINGQSALILLITNAFKLIEL